MGRNVGNSEVDWRKKIKGGEVDMGEASKAPAWDWLRALTRWSLFPSAIPGHEDSLLKDLKS